MKKLLFFLSILLIEKVSYTQDIKKFDSLFKTLPECTIKITSDLNIKDGVVLDKKIGAEFSQILQENFNESNKYYAIFKYSISQNIKGYIYRAPDAETSVDRILLLVYDIKNKKIISIHNIAAFSGDEGWSQDMYSFFVDLNNDKILDIITIMENDDPSTGVSTDISIKLWENNKYSDYRR
jgi:uncharacterized protein YwqG